jgi:Iron-containing redox enzyme
MKNRPREAHIVSLEMQSLGESDLCQACVQSLGSQLDDREERALRLWWKEESGRTEYLAGALLARPAAEWARAILEHRAHRHAWYDQLAHEASLRDFAAFLLENWAFPAFQPLVERALRAQICEEGRTALRRNLEDEQVPAPHADLMRRLMEAVKAKAGDGVPLETYPSLIDRTLVFYYGYYCDPWHLVGSLFTTEVLAFHRLTQMQTGLLRLGLEPADLEFIRVHLSCDEDHAGDWSAGVIEPSARLDPRLRARIAQGIAACLETSVRYLDDLSQRACGRTAGGTE